MKNWVAEGMASDVNDFNMYVVLISSMFSKNLVNALLVIKQIQRCVVFTFVSLQNYFTMSKFAFTVLGLFVFIHIKIYIIVIKYFFNKRQSD